MPLPWTFSRLVGRRVTLDPLRPDDLEPLFAMQSDPEVCRYLLYEPRSREKVEEVLARDAGAILLEKPGDYLQPVIRDEHGAFAGTLYLELKSVDDRAAEIGWILLPSAQGHGYAAEAASLLLDFCFDQLELHRVYAELDPRNTASVALCLRLGMRHEGHFVEDMFLKGEWTDTGRYAILDREWSQRRSASPVA
ncbi:GNAT family protein [Microbacterium sp. LjRoot45]|uniref:GNAT family protein n=1 Tax=Candidatus Microbacterium phytovorans TaxID=3121374 RepID=A0AAJ5VZX6_9MICO|nr:GNAT family protein [Microbacterium sp.]WEK12955.1 MAG: GNAT family protein [Microbacterium sp.]